MRRTRRDASPRAGPGPGAQVLFRKLGLDPSEERPGGLLYDHGQGAFALFESTGASSGEFTQMGWEVDDIEATVAEPQRPRGRVRGGRRPGPEDHRGHRRGGGQLPQQGRGGRARRVVSRQRGQHARGRATDPLATRGITGGRVCGHRAPQDTTVSDAAPSSLTLPDERELVAAPQPPRTCSAGAARSARAAARWTASTTSTGSARSGGRRSSPPTSPTSARRTACAAGGGRGRSSSALQPALRLLPELRHLLAGEGERVSPNASPR